MPQFKTFSVILLLMAVFAFLPSSALAVPASGTDSLYFPQQEGMDLESRDKPDPARIKQAFRKGNVLLAGNMAEAALEEEDLPELRCILSIAHSVQGRLDKAKNQLDRVSEENVDPSFLLSARATLAFREKRRGQAIELSRKAADKGSPHPYPHHLLAALHAEMQNDDLAKQHSLRALEIAPEFSPAHTNLGFVFLRKKNIPEAARHFKQAIDLQPEQSASYYGLALVHEQEGRLQEAIRKLRQSLAHNESFIQAMDMLATLYLSTDQPGEALQTARTMKSYGAENAGMLIARGLIKQGQPEQALSHLQSADISDPRAVMLKGLCLMLLERYEEAQGVLSQTQGSGPLQGEIEILRHLLAFMTNGSSDSSGGWEGSNKGQRKMHAFIDACIAMRDGKWAAAEQRFQESEQIWSGWTLQGLSQETLKQASKKSSPKKTALAAYYTLNKLPSYTLNLFKGEESAQKSFLVHYISSIASTLTDAPQEAVSSLRAALEKAPNFYSAHQRLGDLLASQNKPGQSAAHYVKAYSIQQNPMLLYRAGKNYEKTDKVKKTEEMYTKLIENHPSLYIGYAQLAWLYADKGIKLEKGLELAQEANKLQPDNPIILDTIGWLHYKMDRIQQASRTLNQAVSINDEIPSLLYHLAIVQFETGNTTESKKNLEKALAISEQFDAADKAREFLKTHFSQ